MTSLSVALIYTIVSSYIECPPMPSLGKHSSASMTVMSVNNQARQ
jgi:hypothetical protein